MKLKSKLSTILILFPVVFLLFINPIFTQVSADDIYVDIDDDVFELLHANSKSEKQIAKNIIKKNLREAYKLAFLRFDKKKNNIKNEAGKDLKCIVNAIDSFRNSLSKFSIYFTFSEEYKDYLDTQNMDIITFPGDRDGEGLPVFKEGEEIGITVKNVFMRDNYFKKFVTNYKECQFNAFLQCILDENRSLINIKKDSYTGRKIKNFYNPEDSKYKWTKKGLIKGVLQAIIFYEFVHLALFHSSDKVAKSRWGDEATVEDFVSKIFDQEDEFIGPYLCERKGSVQEKFKFRRNQNENNDYFLFYESIKKW
jgi:hypothetical protein